MHDSTNDLLDIGINQYAEAWANGRVESAREFAQQAHRLWHRRYHDEYVEKAKRLGAVWPIPGCPEADEDGSRWQDYYGGYGGTGA